MGSTFSNNLVSALRPQPVGPGGPMRWTAFPSVLQCFASNHRCWPECVTTRATLSRAYITYNNAQRRDSIMLNQINANTFGFVLLLFFDPPLSISGLTQRPKKNTNHITTTLEMCLDKIIGLIFTSSPHFMSSERVASKVSGNSERGWNHKNY